MKPYAMIPVADCRDALVPIPPDTFAMVTPHPYMALNAPYGDKSPYFVRSGVLERLTQAQLILQAKYPGWQLQIFDAYRPIPVQQFMVDYTFTQLLQQRHLKTDDLSPQQRHNLLQEVFQFWAVPSHDPATPPPHSTGAAIDLTLVDAQGLPVDMGSPIDEVSPRSFPGYFAAGSDYAGEWIVDGAKAQTFDQHRQLLYQVMTAAGFQRHPQEWWHFSYGDQLWAWLLNQEQMDTGRVARYGAI
ncbi:MAG: M15 family metallopeptidase [Leptolyngbyaceae bacterium]|nr:M15 family metallopeptidase [Leptolyngbyaceae bacterium]